MTDEAENKSPPQPRIPNTSRFFRFLVYANFAWITVGVSMIYGYRLYADSPLHHSFIPIAGAAFAAAIAFSIVLSLEFTSGKISLKLLGLEFEGASGPIVLWCFCFLSVAIGLNLLGFSDVVDNGYERTAPCFAHALKSCDPALIE